MRRLMGLVVLAVVGASCATTKSALPVEPVSVSDGAPAPEVAPGATPSPPAAVPEVPVPLPGGPPAFPSDAPAATAKRILAGGPDAVRALREAFAFSGVETQGRAGDTAALGARQVFRLSGREAVAMARIAASEPTVSVEALGELFFTLAKAYGGEDAFTADPRMKAIAEMFERGEPPTDEERERVEAEFQALQESLQKNPAQPVMWSEQAATPIAVEYVAGQLRWAKAHPESPRAFGPLLVEALVNERAAKNGERPPHLAEGLFDPSTVRLTLPEVLLLVLTPLSSSRQAGLPGPLYAGDPVVPLQPCSEFLGNDHPLEPVGRYLGGKAGGQLLEWLLPLGEVGGLVLSGTLALVRLVMWVVDSATLEVTAQPSSAHYRHHADETKEVVFLAKATVNEPTEEPLLTRTRDCLDYLGIDLPDSAEAVKATMEKWKIFWNPDGLDGHASISGKKNRFKYSVPTMGGGVMVSGNSATAKAIVDMALESDEADPKTKPKHDTMWLEAALDTSTPPDWSMLVKTAINSWGNPIAAALDATIGLAVGWAKKVVNKTARGRVQVEYHLPPLVEWKGRVEMTRTMKVNALEHQPFGEGVETIGVDVDDETNITLDLQPGREGERNTNYVIKQKGHSEERRSKDAKCCNSKSKSRTEWDYSGFGWERSKIIFDEKAGTFVVQTILPGPNGFWTTTFENKGNCCGTPISEGWTNRAFATPLSWGNGLVICGGYGKKTDKTLKIEPEIPSARAGPGAQLEIPLKVVCKGQLKRVDLDDPDAK